jgi:cytochrome c oxidase cbb3-type subunit 3
LLLVVQRASQGDDGRDNTTGHVWDGDLREMNNPLPRWWVWLFVITIVFASGLSGACIPVPGTFKGQLAWTQKGSTRPKWPSGGQQGNRARCMQVHRHDA